MNPRQFPLCISWGLSLSRIGAPGDLPKRIKGPVIFAGSRIDPYVDTMKPELDSSGISYELREAMPGGAAVARLAADRLERGESDDALSLTPMYLKESTARAFINRYRANIQAEG